MVPFFTPSLLFRNCLDREPGVCYQQKRTEMWSRKWLGNWGAPNRQSVLCVGPGLPVRWVSLHLEACLGNERLAGGEFCRRPQILTKAARA
jgi:hypothetical protein